MRGNLLNFLGWPAKRTVDFPRNFRCSDLAVMIFALIVCYCRDEIIIENIILALVVCFTSGL